MMRRPNFFILIICIIGLSCNVLYGEELKGFDTNLVIGHLVESGQTLKFKEETFSLYEVNETTLLPIETLLTIGVKFDQIGDTLVFSRLGKEETLAEIVPYSGTEVNVRLGEQPILIGYIPTYHIKVEKTIMIPVETLGVLYDLTATSDGYRLEEPVYSEANYLKILNGSIVNCSAYPIYFDYIDMYWDGENFIDLYMKNQVLPPRCEKKIEIQPTIEGKAVIYLNTYIETIQDFQMPSPESYGQRPIPLYNGYMKVKRIKALEKIFPKFKVTAKINYKVGQFENGEEVELWRSEKGQYHVILDEKGKKVTVPLGSITIIGDNGQWLREATQKELEDYVNLKDYESQTEYLLWTDLLRQRTYAFKGEKNQWELVKVMKCSTGKDKSLTPSGHFEIEYKVPYFGMEKGYRCKNASVIFRDYMYHSILFDKTGEYVKSGLYQLGSRVSHGCIRLSEEDSGWIYKNIPEKTKVYIE